MEGSLGFLFIAFLIIPLPHFFVFCIEHTDSKVRCIDSERHALLKFKQDLIDPSNRLSSWTIDGDCCHWLGVVCHNLIAHVHHHHLSSYYEQSMFGVNIGAMRSLESIDFYMNQLSGQIPSSMSSLTFLNHLNLSNNNLTGKIPLSTQL
nr:receptor-like protein EIX2 [Quercus suber]